MPSSTARWGIRAICRPSFLAAVAVTVRVLAAAALILGPWTDEPAELDGWDVDRFQQIADASGAPYLDHEVEYPVLTVVIAELVLDDDVVSSHRRLVFSSLVIDLSLAAVLARWWSSRVAVAYLLLGLPLVPMGLLRLDLWAALAAVIAAAAIAPSRRSGPSDLWQRSNRGRFSPTVADLVFVTATVIGAMIKLWPALLVAGSFGLRRAGLAIATGVIGIAAGALWLSISGVEAINQITSLRGVTGWHVESIPGTLTSLTTADEPRLEADAFRIGTLDDTVVTLARFVAVAVTAAATILAARSQRPPTERLSLVMLAATTALIVTAPLLSPQFLLWLTPWAAILYRDRLVLGLTAAAVVLTAVVLAVFGPPDLAGGAPAFWLLVRNGILLAVVAVSLHRLARPDRSGLDG